MEPLRSRPLAVSNDESVIILIRIVAMYSFENVSPGSAVSFRWLVAL